MKAITTAKINILKTYHFVI